MEYLSCKQASIKWNISERRVRYLCQENKVNGAIQIGKSWAIPITTSRPTDHRRKENKNVSLATSYHFPLLIHTTDSLKEDLLDESCKKLLKAQILYTKGQYVESNRLCDYLIKKDTSIYIDVGAYVTIALNCLMLGYYDLFISNMNSIDKYCLLDPLHADDYRMLKSCVELQGNLINDDFNNININNLSSDSINYYLSNILYNDVTYNKIITDSEIIIYKLLLKQLESLGLDVSCIMVHSLLAIIYGRQDKINLSLFHIDASYNLAKKNDCLCYFSKFFSTNLSLVKKYLFDINKNDYLIIYDYAISRNKHQPIVDYQSNKKRDYELSLDEIEYINLSYNGMQDDQIAKIQGVSSRELNKRVHDLYKKIGIKDKNSLHKYIAKNFY